jgi:glycerol-3-phosphate dehydrogenase
MDRVNIVIVGGGVVGCAIACAAAQRWSDVFLLEALHKPGLGASTRNSGVIHSGLYYPPGSLKARHCLRGNRLTYEFCAAHGVPCRRTCKLVVATAEAEESALTALAERGSANGLEGLKILDRAAIQQREPHVAGLRALEVPSTGIVSSEELVKAYARVALARGANILTHARVSQIKPQEGFVRVASEAGEIEARCMVNSAGLYADEIAALMGSPLAAHRIYPVRGDYCELIRAKAYLVNGLVYPLPPPDGLSLGTHLTKTLGGQVLVGPTARYIEDKNDYERGREPLEECARRARRLLPEMTAADLLPAYSGIRAKLVPPGERSAADFIITRDPQFPNVVQLIGIESPGLTSAPAIAEQVCEILAESLA